MIDSIIIEFNPFIMETGIFVYKEGRQEKLFANSNINDLAQRLIAVAYDNDIYNIKFRGPLAMTTELKNIISEYENTLYSTNKINIEGI